MFVKVETVPVSMTTSSGIMVQEFIQPDQLKSHYVRILEAPDELPYYGHQIAEWNEKYKGDLPSNLLSLAQTYNLYTSEVDVPVEVVPGDICLCRHAALVESDEVKYMRYDDLVARIDGPVYYPLNGYLFIEVIKEKSSGIRINDPKAKWDHLLNCGVVKHQGARVASYRIRPGAYDDKEDWTGRTVYFRPFMASRIEHDAYKKQDGEFSMWKIHKLHVNGYK